VVLERTSKRHHHHHHHHHHQAASLSSPSAFESAGAQAASELSLKRNLNNIEVVCVCVSKLHCSTSTIYDYVLTYASLSVPASELESLRLAGLLVGFKKLGRAEASLRYSESYNACSAGPESGSWMELVTRARLRRGVWVFLLTLESVYFTDVSNF
jgi:hypothetical protein